MSKSTTYTLNGTYKNIPYEFKTYTNIHGDERYLKLKYDNKQYSTSSSLVFNVFDSKICTDTYYNKLNKEFGNENKAQFTDKDVKAIIRACILNEKPYPLTSYFGLDN